MSGHNKWSTIKRKKGALDSKRSKIFSRISKEIFVAVKEAGPDPNYNPRLRLAINNGKGVNMPKDNITRAIAKGEADGSTMTEVIFEGMANGGVAIIVECLTDNNQRTVANIRSIFNKRGGTLGTKGSCAFVFERKGVVRINKTTLKVNIEDLELELIDAGLQDLDQDDDGYTITTALEDFGNMRTFLEKMQIEAENAELQWIPTTTKEVTPDIAKSVLKMVEAFEEDDDVQTVYHNLEMTDELAAALDE